MACRRADGAVRHLFAFGGLPVRPQMARTRRPPCLSPQAHALPLRTTERARSNPTLTASSPTAVKSCVFERYAPAVSGTRLRLAWLCAPPTSSHEPPPGCAPRLHFFRTNRQAIRRKRAAPSRAQAAAPTVLKESDGDSSAQNLTLLRKTDLEVGTATQQATSDDGRTPSPLEPLGALTLDGPSANDTVPDELIS